MVSIDRKLQIKLIGAPLKLHKVQIKRTIKNGEIIAPEIKTWWRLEFNREGKIEPLNLMTCKRCFRKLLSL